MLAGRLPFEGDSAVSIALKHLSEPPAPISHFRPDVHPALESVVMAALAKDPARRWQSAEDFGEGLAAAGAQLGDVPPDGTAPTAFVPIPAPVPAGADGDSTAPPALAPVSQPERPPEKGKRRRWPWVLIGLLTLALVGFLTYLAVDALTEPETREVPRVVGRQLVQASAVLERAGFEVEQRRVRSRQDFDQVLDQDPDAAEEAEEGSTVLLEVSDGPGTVLVPTVRRLPQGQAIDELEERDLRANVDRLSSEEVPAGLAIRTVPGAGTEVERGERIQLFISSGPELVAVPSVIGLSRDSAEAQISDAGMVPAVQEIESEEPEGEVIGQDPSAGTELRRGSTVTITVSTGIEQVVVPDVVGLGAGDAERQLRAEGLSPVQRETEVTEPGQDGQVIDQRPGAGVEVEPGRQVVLIVGALVQQEELAPLEPDPPPAETTPAP
jgi:eukaryotic-like serine/threonine-protein kinase